MTKIIEFITTVVVENKVAISTWGVMYKVIKWFVTQEEVKKQMDRVVSAIAKHYIGGLADKLEDRFRQGKEEEV